jgi:asparagine synthase (glutamine-hydrolysing)
MSGFVGIFHLDGGPVDIRLLQRMTGFLAFRGPDAQETWCDGPIGLGHALLRTAADAGRQPASLDGQVWIAADVRIDARTELIEKLAASGRELPETISDAELVLHAYHAWEEACVEHLLGDFAFALWDGRRRKMFCVRDHFGVRPFYYAHLGNVLIVSNTLECVRMHPAISSDLNELAIADFLLIGMNGETETTTFADIRRLPAAHAMTCDASGPRVRRYWTLPIEEPLQFKCKQECLAQFQTLLRTAVEDRLRTDTASIFLSGGLDSASVAAVAKEVLSKRSPRGELRGVTVVYDRLIPDRERHYSGIVARSLGIPVDYLVADDFGLFENRIEFDLRTPEPTDNPLQALECENYRQAARYARVLLTGEGGDPGLSTSLSLYFRRLLRTRRFVQAFADGWRYLTAEGRMSRLYLRTRLRLLRQGDHGGGSYPSWLDAGFKSRLRLTERWEQLHVATPVEHPVRPSSYQALTTPYFQWVFEAYDPGKTRTAILAQHPIFDLRVMRFLLRMPAIPWATDKMLLRESLRGVLPDEVRLRRKSPLAGEPIYELMQNPGARWIDEFETHPELGRFVDRRLFPRVAGEKNMDRLWASLRAVGLNFWLHAQFPVRGRVQVAVENRRRDD